MWKFEIIIYLVLQSHLVWANEHVDSASFHQGARYHQQAKMAMDFLETISLLESNERWPQINTRLFLKNLKQNIENPEWIYQGNYTNFCGYAALTHLLVISDPLVYAHNMIALYKHGKIKYGKKWLQPGKAVRFTAGTLQRKGALDSLHADQLWFLTLADQFKGYVNFFHRQFDKGYENTMWAGVNYAKFNKMARQLIGVPLESIGTDLVKPALEDLPDYLQSHLKKGSVVLMTNSRIKEKPTHAFIKFRLPVHFIVLRSIRKMDNNMVSIDFWDYGKYKNRKMSLQKWNKTVFGVTTFLDTPLDLTANN